MGRYVAENTVKTLIRADVPIKKAVVAVLGFTFKENVPDTRNTKVIDIISELCEYGVTAIVSDLTADEDEARRLYGMTFVPPEDIRDADAVLLAVAHDAYRSLTVADFDRMYKDVPAQKKVIIDIKGLLDRSSFEAAGYLYWSL
jgi:UDP-N-acetyl-D-galactosamine dehydrogenase